MDYKDYYKILGVPRTAAAADIKKAYRKLAREFHPDKNKAKGAEDRFKEVNEANEVLSDVDKRKSYDELGENWRSGQRFSPPPGWNGARRGRGAGTAGAAGGGADFSDFFSTMFGGAGGGFAPEAEDSRDVLTVTLEESYSGGSRRLMLAAGRSLDVKIPKGVMAGQTIRLTGQGRYGGDLLLEIKFAPHPRYEVQGRDLTATLPIAPWEAALGAPVNVPTLGGTVELKLPAGTQSGKKMRLKGRGLPGGTPGDQFIVLQIVMPPMLNDDDKIFYDDMSKRFAGFDPRA